MAPNGRRVTRKWELFAGRNKFYCDGYLMTAPNSSIFYLTVVLITGTSGLFFAFDCWFLAERITPAIPVIGAILYVFTMCSLLRTSFSDPGIIPRASHDEAAYIEKQIEVPNALNSPTYRPPPRTKEIFVGNCVGRRNYRFFYMFIVSLAFLAVFIFACALTHLILLKTDEDDLFQVIRKSPFSLVVSIICFLSVWSVIGLAGFHTYLTTSDQTTNEDIKGSFSSKGGQPSTNPYSHGNIFLNCFYILCGPLQPSLIDRRGIVTEEYRLQMQAQDKYNVHPVPPLVMQPIVSGVDPLGKTYNNLEIEAQNPNNLAGVYRQRSYDNLQNEKSTSIAHLVDNELPLAIIPSTSEKRLTNADNLPGTLNNPNELEDDGCATDELTLRKNNLSGSYNNLFRENSNLSNISSILNKNALNDDSRMQICYIDEQPQPKLTENVYSNVPTTTTATSNSTPEHHVYSNIDEEKIITKKAKINPMHLTTYPTATENEKNIQTFMANDLDLDDPLQCSFIKDSENLPPSPIPPIITNSDTIPNQNIYNTNANLHNELSPKLMLPSISSSSSTTNTQITSIELKNVLNVFNANQGGGGESDAKTKAAPQVVVPTTSSSSLMSLQSSSPVNNSSVTLSSSRLRLLQDTTMIDTALDLDSLDGSSIGNNSQSCLVNSKTAIV